MDDLVTTLYTLQQSPVAQIIHERINEFHMMHGQPGDIMFLELCFCIFTANCSSQKCWDVQNTLGEDLLHLSTEDLEHQLRLLGYRFPNRADRVVAARNQLPEIMQQLSKNNGKEIREWLVQNITGFGYKEASHFLRNIGFDDVAIIDVHILRVLEEYGMISSPKTLTKKRYLAIEKILETLADHSLLTLAELDLYLWYMRTGKVLK